jgi:hypothetical protein
VRISTYLGRRPKDWNVFMFIIKTEADIRHVMFFTHAKSALKSVFARRVCTKKWSTHVECALKNGLRMLSLR